MYTKLKFKFLFAGLFSLILGACSESPDGNQAPDEPAPPSDAPQQTQAEAAPAPGLDQPESPNNAENLSGSDLPPLPFEPHNIVESLPDRYPESWFLVHDAAFFSMSDGKVTVVDAAADVISDQVKGSFNVALIGSVTEGLARSEIYTSETFYSRGTRGDRTDVVTIWDKANLSPIGEVILPGNSRFQGMPERNTLQLIDNERFLLAFNMNPATSISVIDVDARKITAEIAIPGCVKAFPTGQRAFSSLCADGRFMTTELNEDGTLAKQSRGEVFFDSDTSPVFQRAAFVDGTGYFPSFDGQIHPIDMSGQMARPGTPWHLVPEDERAEGWRPGGLGLIDRDASGHLYILMHPEGGDGSHQSGGAEVWVFDPSTQTRVRRIVLKEWGLSLGLSRGDQPLLMVTNPVTMLLEIYDAGSGEHIRTLENLFQFTPLMQYGAR
jgi:methylamine dehydrogenase heavy chain